jgi:acetoacetyl-CoA reductase/3-oxoacyl-[acyl-carrier protein] reductase
VRTALVTGASRGLGAGIARALAADGWRVAVGWCTSEARAAGVAGSCADAETVHIDVGDDASVRAAIAEIGELHALVNNAGIAQERPFEELTDDDWMRMLSINLVGAARCARAALPPVRRRGWGRIVNVASIGGQWGGRNQVHYAASKAGLVNFTLSLARLYSAEGITSNCVSPGLVATDMSAAELDTEAGRAKVAQIPLGRLGTVDEVGGTVAWLCSDDAAYVTGQTINLNGGMFP